jgi:PKD repeat protein
MIKKKPVLKAVLLFGMMPSLSYAAVCDMPNNLCNGLAAYYPFEGNANDATANNNHGTNHGATLTTDRVGNPTGAYRFSNNDIEVPHNAIFDVSTGFAISVWVKPNVMTQIGQNQDIVSKTSSGGYSLFIREIEQELDKGQSQFGFSAHIGGYDRFVYSAPHLDSRWYHVVGVYDNSNMRVYVDGVLEGSKQMSGDVVNNSASFVIGNESGQLNEPFNGPIDEVRFYNRPLSDSDVGALYTVLLTVDADGTGAGTVTGAELICPDVCISEHARNSIASLTAAPKNIDSFFAGWGGACSGSAPSCDVTMSQAQNVTATFTATPPNILRVTKGGNGTISSSPTGIICGADCEEPYRPSTLVALTATPDEHYLFAGWSGDCSGTSSCQVSMAQERNVTATFNLKEYQFGVSKLGTGTGTITGNGINCGSDCSELYPALTTITLTATPTADSLLANWGGACSGAATTCQITMDQIKDVTATFNLKDYQLSVSKPGTGSGTIIGNGINCGSDCSELYQAHTPVTLTATPAADSFLANWGGACSGTATSCQVTMDQVKDVIATFERKNLLIVTKQGNGTVTSSPVGINCGVDCEEAYPPSTSVTLTANADTDYLFTGWTGACSGTTTCVVPMNQAQTVGATFQVKCNYRIAPTSFTHNANNGTGTVNVTVYSGCEWTAASHNDWLTITSGNSGNGNGTVNYSVVSNPSQTGRNGQLTIAELPFAVTQEGNKAPVAQFTATPMIAVAPVTVKLDGSRSFDTDGTVVSYEWKRFDGRNERTASGEQVEFNFSENKVGQYDISLIVTDNQGLSSNPVQKTITVQSPNGEKPPIAVIDATPTSANEAPLTVELSASRSSDTDGNIVEYQWASSDSQTASGEKAVLTFAQEGIYTVTLTVIDNDGLKNQTEQNISVGKLVSIEFQGFKESYNIGEPIDIKLKVNVKVDRFNRVDLWLAIQLPSGLLFKTPIGINSFQPTPQAFHKSLETVDNGVYGVLRFELVPGLGGSYTFLAAFFEEGKNPMDYLDNLSAIQRSEFITRTTILASE